MRTNDDGEQDRVVPSSADSGRQREVDGADRGEGQHECVLRRVDASPSHERRERRKRPG